MPNLAQIWLTFLAHSYNMAHLAHFEPDFFFMFVCLFILHDVIPRDIMLIHLYKGVVRGGGGLTKAIIF